MALHLDTYRAPELFDELFTAEGTPRPPARQVVDYFSRLPESELATRVQAVDAAIQTMGITFTVYSDGANIDRAWPFDVVPRVIDAREWRRIEAGLRQRLQALNLFIDDVYGDQKVIKDKIVPAERILGSRNYHQACRGATPRFGVWAHICGTDLVRGGDGQVYVLEDNLRVPSGVSYMLENRHLMKRIFPELFRHQDILPINEYPVQLLQHLSALAPGGIASPEVVVLTPGIFNSAYFEHSYLAQQMGAELVQGPDLVVEDERVYMKTVQGLAPVDVIYRRIDDAFLDPEAFRPDSMLGVPGLMRAWRAGNVAIANAPGAGVADDKVIYSYVPQLIRYYLDEDAILPNVPTRLCGDPATRKDVLRHLDQWVVKPANESGGYGILVGPHASEAERRECAARVKADPENYIAQPMLQLSCVPTRCGERAEPRHVDLRPFIIQSDRMYVTTGGLSRVALRAGSLVVNSSQGGGSKDTWVVETGGGD